jgi:hypothetical protein
MSQQSGRRRRFNKFQYEVPDEEEKDDEDELRMTPPPHELATKPSQDLDYDKIDFPKVEIGEIRLTFCVQETWPRHLHTRS